MTRTDKDTLLAQIEATLAAELEVLETSARTAHAEATHPDSKPENKYDTRGLEASYLAGAQKARVAEIGGLSQSLRATKARAFKEDDAVAATALVELEHEGVRSLCFVVTQGAGMRLTLEGDTVLALTPQSPLGKALVGKRAGDVASVATAQGVKEYEILSVR